MALKFFKITGMTVVLMLKYLMEWKHNAKPFFTKREAFLYRIDLVDKLIRNKHNNYHSEVCHGVL